ncbi:MAG: restriction endonuclease subunit S [ANME-2 cluster archaeon]|nr:restriction endonuclease subunit S [ANME-2 cluster archaeon]
MNLDTNIRLDWSIVKLGDICEKAAKIKRKEVNPDEEFIYLDIGGIDNQSNRITSHKKYQWEDAPSRAQQIVKVGDTLFSTVRTYLKNIAIVDNPMYENQICSSGFTVIRSINELADSKYLFVLSLSEGFLGPLNKLQTGTSYPAVRDKDVFGQIIPLPPIPEQRTIVSKIEQLFSDLDNGIENFKKAQEQLKIYRQAVLKNACEGKLVPTEAELARNEGRDYEPADVLLARILEERREKWNGKGKYKEPVAPDTSGLAELPEGWKWATAQILSAFESESICAGPFGTIFKAKDFRPFGVPIIFLRHVGPCRYLTHKPNFMDKTKWEELFKPYSVFGGELLITKLGVPPGICAIYPNGIGPAMVTPDVMKMNVNEEVASPRFLMYYFNSEMSRRFTSGSAFGTTRLRITLPIFRNMPIPLPPLAEQHRIVTEVERRLSICDNMEETITESLQKAESLRQSILKKAFEGKLLNEKELEEVRNAPDWEPADKLLERIKAEKTNTKAEKKGKK